MKISLYNISIFCISFMLDIYSADKYLEPKKIEWGALRILPHNFAQDDSVIVYTSATLNYILQSHSEDESEEKLKTIGTFIQKNLSSPEITHTSSLLLFKKLWVPIERTIKKHMRYLNVACVLICNNTLFCVQRGYCGLYRINDGIWDSPAQSDLFSEYNKRSIQRVSLFGTVKLNNKDTLYLCTQQLSEKMRPKIVEYLLQEHGTESSQTLAKMITVALLNPLMTRQFLKNISGDTIDKLKTEVPYNEKTASILVKYKIM